MTPTEVLDVLRETAWAVRGALEGVTDWGPSGQRDSQYAADLVADRAALEVLDRHGFNVVSEESGHSHRGHDITVIVDPLDGSTNASRGIPHFATSLLAVDSEGPLAAVVAHQAAATVWWAVRGVGAFRDGRRLCRGVSRDWAESIVAVSGRPPADAGWGQFRALGASAIDLCFVADGTVDAFIDMSPSAHGVWDYAAATMICREVGFRVEDAQGRELIVLDHAQRRTPVAATTEFFETAMAVRRRLPL